MFIDHSFTKTDRTNHKCAKLVVQGPVHRMGFQKFQKSFSDRSACPHGNKRNYYRHKPLTWRLVKLKDQPFSWTEFAFSPSTVIRFQNCVTLETVFTRLRFPWVFVWMKQKRVCALSLLSGSYFLKKNASSWLTTEGIYVKLFNLWLFCCATKFLM